MTLSVWLQELNIQGWCQSYLPQYAFRWTPHAATWISIS